MQPDTSTLTIRLAQQEDLPAIVAIFNQAIPLHIATAITTPVTIAERQAWFDAHTPDHHPIYVAEIDGQIVGWLSLTPHRPGREAYRFIAELSYYVDIAFQRRGIATALVEHAMQDCSRLRIKDLFGVVLDHNLPSIHMLEKMGFQRWGYLPGVCSFNGVERGVIYFGRRVWDETGL